LPRYELRYATVYLEDLRSLLRPYDLPVIVGTVNDLADQAETVSRNRRPLGAPISWCPTATWQLRVGDYRVLYRVDEGVVSVLRVRFKGSKTTEEMGR
jgi:mRNA-degrading endonuclease RelE of RelBE toxin-antitoxin system